MDRLHKLAPLQPIQSGFCHAALQKEPHPEVYARSRDPPFTVSPVEATKASSVASTGVLQGLAARAKVRPARYACTGLQGQG